MAVKFDTIDELVELRGLESEWRALAGTSRFVGPSWLIPWWHAYRRVLDAKLFVLVGRNEEDELVCLAPFYQRVARVGPGLKVREVRMLGDAGPRPPALDLLVAPSYEREVGAALGDLLSACSGDWDLIDLEPLREPSTARAYMVNRLASSGFHVESSETPGARCIALNVPGNFAEAGDGMTRIYEGNPSALRKGLSRLRRLSRIEWADREETSPLADEQASNLLEDVAAAADASDGVRLARLDNSDGVATAVALVMDDADAAVVLAVAMDPDSRVTNAVARLLAAEAFAAHQRGLKKLVVVTGAMEHDPPPLPITKLCSMRVSIYGQSKSAALARHYGALRRRVDSARIAPGAAAAGARAAWSTIRTAAANVAGRERMHLYRGEMWTRGIVPTAGLKLSVITEEEFDALSESENLDMRELLQLDVDSCREKWQRGDLAFYAALNQRPAGIGWCARRGVEVPEIGRTLRLKQHEAYIHDLYVAPQARGRGVAPAMLEFIAQQLRQSDVYRSWALIASDNLASVRAFEKASFTAVADLIYTRVGKKDRLHVRPPDPEAQQLLGLI